MKTLLLAATLFLPIAVSAQMYIPITERTLSYEEYKACQNITDEKAAIERSRDYYRDTLEESRKEADRLFNENAMLRMELDARNQAVWWNPFTWF